MQHRTNKLRNYKITKFQKSSRGYILITLMLFVALLAIAAMAVLPQLAFQIKRDREQEMIHRALEYSRAVKRYYKKFGRYPSRIEELENTNNIRFLRKRYQDPISGKDFKILHLTDVMMNSGPGLGQAPGPGAPGQPGGGTPPLGGLNPGGLIPGGLNPGGLNSGGLNSGPFSPNAPPGPGQPPPANAGDQTAGGDNSGNPPNGQTNANSSASSSSSSSSDTSSPTQQVFGSGGPILGVASASKAKTIRVFDKKDHYNDWLFVYLPQTDRGGLLNAPMPSGLGNTSFVPQPGAPPGQVPPNAGPPSGSPPPVPPNPVPMPPEQ